MNKQFTFPDGIPLNQDHAGTIRVKGSRVTLDTLVGIFKRGDTLDEIAEGFPSLTLAQIDAVIGWYLNHQSEADEYLEEGYIEAERLRREIESQPEYIAFREKLLRYREQRLKT